MTAAARLLLLGPPTLCRGGDRWVLPFERRSQLLVLLALAGSWVGRRSAATMLWPEAAGPLAATNLRKTLFRLAATPWGDCVQSEGGALRFDGSTDAADFEAALREGRTADALALWHSEPLAGFDDAANPDWTDRLAHDRERLRTAWRGAALAWLERPDTPAASAVALSARLLESDPWDETALRLHVQWLQRGGQADVAARALARFVQRVREDLGVSPSAAVLALGGEVVRGSAPSAPPTTDAAAAAAEGDFIGRGAELRRIADLLAPEDGRHVTIVGPGGVGKTRLARRAAELLADRFADGVLQVALEGLADPEALPARLARELGLPAGGTDTPLERVLAHLATRRLLLVLDNFEQLAAGSAVLAPLRVRCPGVKLLVTSRLRLGLAGEQLLPLDGLPCPEPEDADRIEAFDAVRLFERAARRVDPSFRSAGEAGAVGDICRGLGGLPLAIELAAAWARVLPCDEIAAELRRGIALLRSRDAGQPARHASIEAVFEQSWQLLAEAERDTLARLSVFRGGFSAAAAREVAGAAPPVLAVLADHSLLQKEGARIHLHPLVQQLAAQRLAAPAAAAASAAHARYFLGTMARCRVATLDGDRETLRELDVDFDNCRAAWQAAAAAGEAGLLARASSTLTDYANHRGRHGEGLALFEEALAAPGIGRHDGARAMLHNGAAHLYYRLDRYAEAESAAGQALALADAHDDLDGRLFALNTLASCAMQRGRLDDAARLYREHLRLAPPEADPHRAARTLNNLAMVAKLAGQFEESMSLHGQALVLHQRYADAAAEGICLHCMGLLHLSLGQPEAARARLDAALALCDRHGFAWLRPIVLGALVDHARAAADFTAAERHATEAMAGAEALGLRGLMCGLKLDFVQIALHQRRAADARAALVDAAGLALAIDRPILQLQAACGFADLLAATGAADAACGALALAVAHPLATAPERDTLRRRAAAWQRGAALPPPPPTPDFDALVRRIVSEAGIDHAVLTAELRAAAAAGGSAGAARDTR